MGLMKKLTSALVASSLVFSLVGTAAAAYTPAAGETAGKRMQDLKILTGYADGTLQLNNEITRAELVTVIVRAFGKEADAQLLKGSTAFPDIANHWASGNIAMAKALVEKAGGDAIGMPDGSFAPDAKLTPAQAVAFLMKFIGVKADAAKAWPNNYLDVAVEKNLITAEDKALIAPQLNSNATRGLTFYLFDRAFFSYDLGAGKTFYTKYVDPTEPMLTVNAVDATTIDSKVTITGNVKDAVSLFVGTTAVTPDAAGNFTATYDLPELKEYPITVTARDLAGNTKEVPVKVTRIAGTAAAIEASDITVAAGGTVEVKAVVKDAKGNVVVAPVTGTATAGTYADGKYTAGSAIGTAELTLKAGEVEKKVNVTVVAGALATIVPSKASVAPGEFATFSAKDAAGNVIASGVTYSLTSADASIDANGKFIGSEAGTYTVTATQGTVTVTGKIGVYGDATELVVSGPATMTANTTLAAGAYDDGTLYDVTVSLVDENGNLVASDSDTYVTIEAVDGLAFFDEDEDVVGAGGLQVKNGVATFKVGVETTYDGDLITVRAYNLADANYDLEELEGEMDVTGAERIAKSVVWSGASAWKYVSSVDAAGKTMTLKVKDQDGVVIDDASYNAEVKVTGQAGIDDVSTKEDTIEISAGVGTFDLIPEYGVTGTVTVVATVDGLGSAETKATLAVPSNAKTVTATIYDADDEVVTTGTAGETYTVKLEAVDEKGVPTAKWYDGDDIDGKEVTISFNDFEPGDNYVDVLYPNPTPDADPLTDDEFIVIKDGDKVALDADGKFEFTVEPTTFTSTLPIKVSATNLTASTASLAVKADVAAKIGLTLYNSASTAPDTADVRFFVPVSNPTFNMTAQLYDGSNNKVAKAGVKVTFNAYKLDATAAAAVDEDSSKTGDITINGKAKTYEAVTDENGAATVKVEARTVTDTDYTIVITEDDEDLVLRSGRTMATFQVAGTVVKTVETFVRRPGTTNSVTTILNPATDTVEIWAKVTDNYGRAVSGAEGYLRLNLANEILYNAAGTDDQWTKNEWIGGTTTDADELGLTWEESADAGMYRLMDGAAVAELQIAKAGTQSIVVEYKGATTAVAGSKSVVVKAAPLDSFIVLDKNGNEVDELTIKARKVEGPFTIKLADEFGNTVATTASTVVTVTTDAGIGLRANANDTNTGELKFRSSQEFYLSASAADTYDVTFTAGAVTLTLTVTAE